MGTEAIHFGSGYVMFAFEGLPAGGLFNWKLDTGDGRVYSLDTTDSSVHQVGQHRYHSFSQPCVLARV